jgi:hypothetical protein
MQACPGFEQLIKNVSSLFVNLKNLTEGCSVNDFVAQF